MSKSRGKGETPLQIIPSSLLFNLNMIEVLLFSTMKKKIRSLSKQFVITAKRRVMFFSTTRYFLCVRAGRQAFVKINNPICRRTNSFLFLSRSTPLTRNIALYVYQANKNGARISITAI